MDIPFFSPKMEIHLCGQATLASAKVIFNKSKTDEIHLVTIQNINLHIQKSGEEIIMKFPVYDTVPADAPRSLLDALGMDEVNNSEYNKEAKYYWLKYLM